MTGQALVTPFMKVNESQTKSSFHSHHIHHSPHNNRQVTLHIYNELDQRINNCLK